MKKFLKKVQHTFWSGYQNSLFCRQRNDEEIVHKQRLSDEKYLEKFGYKVYSQNDEDGIVAEIFNRIGTTNKIFVEFGVQNGLECNSHFLLHLGWKGLWIEGSKKYCKEIRKFFGEPLKNRQLKLVNGFIDKDNINSLIHGGLKEKVENIDLLSIDIDGNDYWVWKAINVVSPNVVIIEYNAKFPPTCEWIMPYNATHIWHGDDEQGASLKSLEKLGMDKGYQLVATNMTGSNAFFVKQELANGLFALPATAENLYNACGFKKLHYISGHPSRKYIGNKDCFRL